MLTSCFGDGEWVGAEEPAPVPVRTLPKTGPFDRRGASYVNWNTDAWGFERGTDPTEPPSERPTIGEYSAGPRGTDARLEEEGLVAGGTSPDDRLIEVRQADAALERAERGGIGGPCLHILAQLRERLLAKAGADLAAVDQLAVLVAADQQRLSLGDQPRGVWPLTISRMSRDPLFGKNIREPMKG